MRPENANDRIADQHAGHPDVENLATNLIAPKDIEVSLPQTYEAEPCSSAGGSLELVTPVRLRFQAQGAASQDRFVWSIAHAPEGVQLTFTLDLPAPFDRPFDAPP